MPCALCGSDRSDVIACPGGRSFQGRFCLSPGWVLRACGSDFGVKIKGPTRTLLPDLPGPFDRQTPPTPHPSARQSRRFGAYLFHFCCLHRSRPGSGASLLRFVRLFKRNRLSGRVAPLSGVNLVVERTGVIPECFVGERLPADGVTFGVAHADEQKETNEPTSAARGRSAQAG